MSADWGDHVAAFENAMNQRGLMPVEGIQADGLLKRCKMDGDTEKNGFYALHIENGRAWGMFGHWVHHPEPILWSSKGSKPVDPEYAARLKREIAASRQQAAAEKAESQAAAAQQAQADWKKLKDTDAEHPYLIAKHIGPHGAKETPDGRQLVIPVFINEKISSLQYISGNGEKLFLKGGKTAGGYYRIGGKPNGTIYIAEGFASGATVREASKGTVLVAFSDRNLKAVAEWAHKKYPDDKIIIVSDNDLKTEGNPGVTHAQAAAAAVGDAVVIPVRAADPERKCDVNDLYVDEGIEAVCKLLFGNQEGTVVTEMDRVEAEDVDWYWEPKIAAKKVTLLAGDPGLGKSFLGLSMAAVISNGGQWIDGGTAPAGDTLLLSLEDDPADTIRPRLDALGADCSKVHLITGVRKRVKGKLVEQMFDLNSDIPALDQALQQRPNVRLVIIDPISAYLGKGGLGGSNSHNNAEMRALLAPLSVLATKYRVAILAITHLNKSPAQVLYRVMGSLAFVALARATWFVVKDPNDPRRRLLMPSKNNIAADNGPGLAYRIQEDEQGRATIAWEPEPVRQSLEEVIVEVKQDSAKGAAAKSFINAWLADGQLHLSAEIKEAALKEGVAKKTYERAQAEEIKAKHIESVIGELKRHYLRKVKEQGK